MAGFKVITEEVDNPRSGKDGIKGCSTRKLRSAPAHGNFAPSSAASGTVVLSSAGNQVSRHADRGEQVSERVRVSLYQVELGVGGHGMGVFDVDGLLDFPTACGVYRRSTMPGIDDLKLLP